ncbi:MAG TPA: hypothetical protein VKN76_09610 [Kiloniellaceae bacterium]|nr:hypothetical protein [Kiloniellaceae bacterium]
MFGFISLIALLALLFLAGLAVLFHRGRKKTAVFLGTAVIVIVSLAFRPACRPIEAADAANFDPPIETRNDSNFYGLKTFQQEDGQWLHCKTWIARAFFF